MSTNELKFLEDAFSSPLMTGFASATTGTTKEGQPAAWVKQIRGPGKPDIYHTVVQRAQKGALFDVFEVKSTVAGEREPMSGATLFSPRLVLGHICQEIGHNR